MIVVYALRNINKVTQLDKLEVETNGTIQKNSLNNAKKMRLDRQVFTDSCKSLMTAHVNAQCVMSEVKVFVQCNAKVSEVLHHFDLLAFNGDGLVFWRS